MQIIIIGNGMYVTGRGTSGLGTIMPAIHRFQKQYSTIDEVHLIGQRVEGVKEAREKGASSENLAALAVLSNKGNLADFSNTIKQLREFRNSPKAKNKAIGEELDHQIAQAMQKLETELTKVITSLKENYSETLQRRNEVRARLVTIAQATSSQSKSNPRFQLLEKREREVLSLRERYELTLSRWQEAKLLVTVDDRQTESP